MAWQKPAGAPPRDEAERPYWISFSDLMSALMVLFLIAMSVALLAVTDEISHEEEVKEARDNDISSILTALADVARDFPGVSVRGNVIDFGERARFESNSHRLRPEQAATLRAFVPRLILLSEEPRLQRWLKRIVVEGFADARGSYIHNLNLSLQRSERVICVLLAPPRLAPDALSAEHRQRVRELFFVGGASFNSLRASDAASRRIELRLEFLEARATPTATSADAAPLTHPPLQEDANCPLDRG